jgi:hypothetical protein
MQTLYASFSNIVLWIGALDALVLLIMGMASAFVLLTGWDAKNFYERVWPAVGVYLGTSVAALVVMLVAKWLSQWFV